MTYPTSSDKLSAPEALATGFANKVLSLMASFFRSLATATEASSRFHQIEALQAKTDEELAAMGLRRNQIARYVFQELFYC